MSKKFKSQDYFRYKKLGKRWRKPVGWQSKMRKKKGGAGLKVSVGYGKTPGREPLLVSNLNDLKKECRDGIIISSSLGSKKTKLISEKAKELGITILNMKKVRRSRKLYKSIEKRKEDAKKEEKKKIAEKEKPGKAETSKETKQEAEVVAEQVEESIKEKPKGKVEKEIEKVVEETTKEDKGGKK